MALHGCDALAESEREATTCCSAEKERDAFFLLLWGDARCPSCLGRQLLTNQRGSVAMHLGQGYDKMLQKEAFKFAIIKKSAYILYTAHSHYKYKHLLLFLFLLLLFLNFKR